MIPFSVDRLLSNLILCQQQSKTRFRCFLIDQELRKLGHVRGIVLHFSFSFRVDKEKKIGVMVDVNRLWFIQWESDDKKCVEHFIPFNIVNKNILVVLEKPFMKSKFCNSKLWRKFISISLRNLHLKELALTDSVN